MRRCALLLVLVLVAGGCAKKRSRARVPTPPTAKTATVAGNELYGYASWYGHPYHGRKTANGEIYDMNAMTAAHRTLEFGTGVDVTNVENGRQVRVRINDRGPFVDGRIIDLSYAAAREIGMIGPGTALVRLNVAGEMAGRVPPESGRYVVQVGAFRERRLAERLRHELARRHASVTIIQEGDLHKVLVGAESTEAAASSLAERLRQEHLLGFVIFVR